MSGDSSVRGQDFEVSDRNSIYGTATATTFFTGPFAECEAFMFDNNLQVDKVFFYLRLITVLRND